MGNRRFAQISTSDEDEDEDEEVLSTRFSKSQSEGIKRKKNVNISEDEEEDEEFEDELRKKKKSARVTKLPSSSEDEEEEEEEGEEPPKPVGECIRFSGKGKGRRRHFKAFELDGNRFDLEDPVLLVPEDNEQKPYVAIIKDITQAETKDKSMMVTGQWFYRPDEAEKKGGGSWHSDDSRQLFYSFHQDEVPAESVMHKCVVHFVPIHKQLPRRKQYPGFIVQKVYDIQNKKLWKLTDKDYEDDKQHEIDILVQKTLSRMEDLPDIETDDIVVEQEEQLKTKRIIKKRNISPIEVTREEDTTAKSDQQSKAETPASCSSNASEYYFILLKKKALTGDTHRDRILEKLLQGIQYMCMSADGTDELQKGGSDGAFIQKDFKNRETESREKSSRGGKVFIWPDGAFPAITSLERAAHEALSADFGKYNQKMRQLIFNLKNELLTRRLLNGELQPSKILSMSPNELKEGLTAEERAIREPEESVQMQMIDSRCSRCNELKVGIKDIIQAGHGDRYQLECIACGYSWYASRDAVSKLTIDAPSSAKTVGTAPLATAKFATVTSPRESDKPPNDPAKKTTEASIPVLDTQKSLGKTKK